MRFCTAINCVDGRVQLPVIRYLQKRFDVEYVDTITEAAPNLILSSQENRGALKSIKERLKISIDRHNSVGIAVVGHHDCAGNPASENEQIKHLRKAIQTLRKQRDTIEVIGLWVSDKWEVHEIPEHDVGR